jgi:hypothetical protein
MPEKSRFLDPAPTVMPLEKLMPLVIAKFGGSTYEVKEGGAAIVGVVDDAPKPYVVKTLRPGLRAVEKKYRLLEECDVLFWYGNDVEGSPPLHIPKAMDYDTNPLHLVLSQVQGIVHGHDQLQDLSVKNRYEAGRRLGRLMAWTNLVLPLHVFVERRSRESPDPSTLNGHTMFFLANTLRVLNTQPIQYYHGLLELPGQASVITIPTGLTCMVTA